MTEQELKEEIASRMYYERHPLGSWGGTTFRNKVIARKSAEYIFDKFKEASYVRLANDQNLPENPYSLPLNDTQEMWQAIVGVAQQDMLKAGWRKVE